jgi:hypothetical protein
MNVIESLEVDMFLRSEARETCFHEIDDYSMLVGEVLLKQT